MITNQRQYKISKAKADEFAAALDSYDPNTLIEAGVDPIIAAAHTDALDSQLQELLHELEEYEALTRADPKEIYVDALASLPVALIKSRIAQGLTQRELAEKLNLKEQQIQRYESQQYKGASFERLVEIAGVLGVNFSGDLTPDVGKIEAEKFPFLEMFNRGWFDSFSGTLADAKKQAEALLEGFFLHSGQLDAARALHRKTQTINAVDEFALAAWQARVLMLAQTQETGRPFEVETISDDWIRELVSMSVKDEGPLMAASFLVECGIHFIVEPRLPKTRLDGASMAGIDGTPIVALTLRYDRIDNFWFTLLHEIGHVVKHISTGQYVTIFDDIDQKSESEIELEADEFASNALVPDEDWAKCVSRFAMSEAAITSDAERIGINPAILAGRIRRESGDYTKFGGLVGEGQVRRLFRQEGY